MPTSGEAYFPDKTSSRRDILKEALPYMLPGPPLCDQVADVPADGYCVELGQREPPEKRGQILATGQFVR
jgi:hypothetical protein